MQYIFVSLDVVDSVWVKVFQGYSDTVLDL